MMLEGMGAIEWAQMGSHAVQPELTHARSVRLVACVAQDWKSAACCCQTENLASTAVTVAGVCIGLWMVQHTRSMQQWAHLLANSTSRCATHLTASTAAAALMLVAVLLSCSDHSLALLLCKNVLNLQTNMPAFVEFGGIVVCYPVTKQCLIQQHSLHQV